MYFKRARSFSPLELEYLKENKDKKTISQIAGMLAQSHNAIKRKIMELEGKIVPGKKNKKSIIGKRKDLDGLFLRSSWEANVCRWYKHLGIKYFYEPKTFVFEGIKRGTVSYLPDLYLPNTDEYIEIKGQLTNQGKTAIRRFKKFYPEEFKKLRAITGSPKTKASDFFRKEGIPIVAFYNEINKEYKDTITYWE